MSDTVSRIAKPQLRGLLQSQIKRHLIISIGMCTAAGLAMHFFYNNRRKQIYADFYKNYDIDKEFNRIRNKGLFDSCEPDN